MKRRLFEDGDEEEGTLGENPEYAHKLEEKKKREELARLEAKYGGDAGEKEEDDDNEDDGEEEEEDEEGTAEPASWHEGFLRVMPLLRSKDPQVYDSRVSFFADAEEEHARRELAAAGTLGDGDGDEELMRLRPQSAEEVRAEDARFQAWSRRAEERTRGGGSAVPASGDAVLMRYWKEDAELDEGERFLRRYIWDRLWLEDQASTARDEPAPPVHSSGSRVDEEDEDDEEELAREEEFERRYNFRFEEPDGAAIPQHPRRVEGSQRVDKQAEARAEKRRERKERKERERVEREQELLRMRRLQKERILEQLAKIQAETGMRDLPFDPRRMLEEDFDSAAWSARMNTAFGDAFYARREKSKPVFEVDPFIDSTAPMGRPDPGVATAVTGGEEEGDSTTAMPPGEEEEEKEGKSPAAEGVDAALESGMALVGKHLKKKQKRALQQQQQQQLDSAELEDSVKKKKKKARQLVDQFYALDFEDIVGGIPCRFKYQEVRPDRSGLSVADILMCDDRKLRKLMPLHSKGSRGRGRIFLRTKAASLRPHAKKGTPTAPIRCLRRLSAAKKRKTDRATSRRQKQHK